MADLTRTHTRADRSVRGCVHAACGVLVDDGWEHTRELEDEVELTYRTVIGEIAAPGGEVDFHRLAEIHAERNPGTQMGMGL